ncbi:MAG: flagellar motor switch protein FliM [Pseudomonadota bacterium]
MNENEILSEEEVDALMEGVASGEVAGAAPAPAGEVQPYDLTDQDHIVRGQLPVLEKINTRFVKQLADGLEQMLQRSLEITEEGLQTVRTMDYIHSLGLPVSLNFISIAPLTGEALVVLDPALVFSIVDIYFGGTGKYRNQMIGREFTPTESRIIQLVLNQTLQDLAAAWDKVLPVEPRFVRAEADPQYSSLAGSREMLIISSFRVEFADCGGEFHIALPVSMIEPIRDLLDGGLRKSMSANYEQWLLALQQNLQDAEVEIFGRMAETVLSLRDVVDMRPGDIIPVGSPGMVTLQVGDVPLFRGQFGVFHDCNAVKVECEIERTDKSRRNK